MRLTTRFRLAFFCCLALACGGILSGRGEVELKVDCAKPEGWRISTESRMEIDGVEAFTVTFARDTEAPPPKCTLSFAVPQRDIRHFWTSESELMGIDPDWAVSFHAIDTQLARSLPVFALFADDDTNRLTVSLSEDRRRVRSHFGVREEDSNVLCRFFLFEEPESAMRDYAITVRIDGRRVFWADAIRAAVADLERQDGVTPLAVPASAYEPLYSTWYAFHQNVADRAIEEECALAAKLGMRTLIVDDGWQTDDTARGYAYTGDWEPSTNRYRDIAAHVKKVQDLGFKYLMWYSIPFAGKHSSAYARFKDKCLRFNDRMGAGVLDPRFPEVREHLAGTFERAMREWNLDGFKFDFIDQFRVLPGDTDPAVAENYRGRDFRTLPEATECLMTNTIARLKALKSDLLIEFRSPYIGPRIRQFGNMLRAGDCPGDAMANRIRTVNLRLLAGGSCVHSDMLEWHPSETAEEAASYVIACLFSTVQYSMMLRNLPERHVEMVRHWVRFQREHLAALQKGDFRPHHPEAAYPLVEAESATERIVAVYTSGTVAPVAADRKTWVVNGTASDSLVVECPSAVTATLFDTCGKKLLVRPVPAGLHRLPVPRSGSVVLTGEVDF